MSNSVSANSSLILCRRRRKLVRFSSTAVNPTKSEFSLFGSRRNLAKLSDDFRAITVCSSVIQCTDVVRGLGVLLDSETSMQRHISNVTSVCFYHLRRLRQILSVNQSWHNLWRHSSSHVLTTATQSLPVYLHSDWCHCNECKTRPLDWCWIWIDERTSVLHYNSCTGFRSCIASRSR